MDRHGLIFPKTNKTHINKSIKMHTDTSKPFTEEKIFMAIEHIKKCLTINSHFIFIQLESKSNNAKS